jgi:hypothetical protein
MVWLPRVVSDPAAAKLVHEMRLLNPTVVLVLLFAAMPPLSLTAFQKLVPVSRSSEFSVASIHNQCIEFAEIKKGEGTDDYRDCAVSDFAEFGAVDGQTYYYALYCLVPSYSRDGAKCGDNSFEARYHRQRGVAIFTQDHPDGAARLLFERVEPDIGTLRYDKPEIVQGSVGTLLYVPIAIDGTGVGNESEYYVREKSEWKSVEAKEWLNELVQRIPPGLKILKGVWPDVHTLRAEAGLYREHDANCCPTGGVAKIQVEIRAERFVIASVSIENEQ